MGGRLLIDQSSFRSRIQGILFFDYHYYFNSKFFALRLCISYYFLYQLIDKRVYYTIVFMNFKNTAPVRWKTLTNMIWKNMESNRNLSHFHLNTHGSQRFLMSSSDISISGFFALHLQHWKAGRDKKPSWIVSWNWEYNWIAVNWVSIKPSILSNGFTFENT